MTSQALDRSPAPTAAQSASTHLRNYYFVRALVSAAWVTATFSIGIAAPSAAAVLLVAYPAWDAAANLYDAASNGGLAKNRTQALNVAVSAATAAGVALSLGSLNAVLGVFGAWAIVSGLLQLATGMRRWKSYGAQWAMILSGAQSSLAGAFFVSQSLGSAVPSIVDIAPYAAFGAFYFLVSTILLTVRRQRTARA
jgi:hypothetical protein